MTYDPTMTDEEQRKKKLARKMLLILVGVDAGAFLLGVALSYVRQVGYRGPTAGAVFVIAVATFLTLLSVFGNVQQAIAGSFVIVYFALLATLSFAAGDVLSTDVAKQMLSNFTTLTGVVVGSYFASATVERVSAHRAETAATTTTTTTTPSSTTTQTPTAASASAMPPPPPSFAPSFAAPAPMSSTREKAGDVSSLM